MKSHHISKAFFIILCCATPFAARAQEEARAAWQVARFDITASVGVDRALTGRAVINGRNVGQGAGRTFTVRLNPAAEIKSTSAGDTTAQFVTRPDPRTKLQQVTITLPAPVLPNGTTVIAVEYRLPVGDNSGLAAASAEGAQFLPLSQWYPSPNTPFAPRGADYAPVRLTVNAGAGEMVVSSGQASGQTFEQSLNAQPFFLTGKWETVDGTGDSRDISAWLPAGASADERQRGEALIALTGAARSFYARLLGAAPNVPLRLVSTRRGAGFETGGTLLLDAAVFRRGKTDSVTALAIAETVARVWVGGATGVQGEGSGAVRDGLARYLATLFLEKQFGREVADAERMRMALLYAPIARRDAPLSASTPAFDTHFNSALNKGALAWRLVAERAVGRDAFLAMLKREFQLGRDVRVSLAGLRTALGEQSNESVRRVLQGVFDQPTDTDLLIGVPQVRGGESVAALRNVGALDVEVSVLATTETGERLTTTAKIPARDFGEARFKTAARIASVEVDPEKLYPQLDYSNDAAPRMPAPEEELVEANRLFAQQQYVKAAESARQILRRAPLMQDARVMLGRALVEQNNLAEAEKEFRAALDATLPSPPTIAWANIGLAEIALRRSQPAEAAKRFDEAARADADYATALAARAGRIKAEAAANAAPPVDEATRTFITQFDGALLSGRKANLESLIVGGELSGFIKGIVGNQPEVWQTRVLRTEASGANRMLVDVAVTTRALNRDQSGTAVFVLARTAQGLRLADIQFFEVR